VTTPSAASRLHERTPVRRLAVCVAALAATLFAASPASAALNIKGVYVKPSSFGSESPVNHEYIVIANTSAKKALLTGKSIKSDKLKATYRFPARYLCGGCSIRVYTGKGSNTTTKLYWGRTQPVWADGKDAAYLRSQSGAGIDRCGWGGGWPWGIFELPMEGAVFSCAGQGY